MVSTSFRVKESPTFEDVTRAGYLPVPLESEDIGGCEFPEGVNFLSNFDILNDPEKLRDYLSEKKVAVEIEVAEKSLLQDLQALGYQKGEKVSSYVLAFPKRVDGKEHFAEKLRMSVVSGTFSTKHDTHLGEYDHQGFDDIKEGFDDNSVGIALVTFDTKGNMVCLAVSDIKYGAAIPTQYDKGGTYTLKKRYIEKYLERASEIEGLVLEQVDFEPDEVIYELPNGDFQLEKVKVITPEGGVPMNTLIDSSPLDIHMPSIEISQFAGSEYLAGGAMFVASALTRLLEKALMINNNLKVGFSISPHLLKSFLTIKNIGFENLLNIYNCDKIDKEEFIKYVKVFAQGYSIFNPLSSKVTKIQYLDGRSVYVLGVYQAETFEVPAYYDLNSFLKYLTLNKP